VSIEKRRAKTPLTPNCLFSILPILKRASINAIGEKTPHERQRFANGGLGFSHEELLRLWKKTE
jgi:hypothetical protein